jgi:hypothetical protein
MINLYAIAQRDLAKDLVFEIDEEEVILSIKGVMIAKADSKSYNLSFVEVSENEFVLGIQMRGYIIYIGLESDEEIDEEVYPELVRALIAQLLPVLNNLIEQAEKMKYRESRKADILLDDNMSDDMREFFYEMLIRRIKNLPLYEQTDVA